jgi:hypothetical protein
MPDVRPMASSAPAGPTNASPCAPLPTRRTTTPSEARWTATPPPDPATASQAPSGEAATAAGVNS